MKMLALLHNFSISSFLLILVLCSLVQIIEAQSYSRLLPQQESNLSHSWHIKFESLLKKSIFL